MKPISHYDRLHDPKFRMRVVDVEHLAVNVLVSSNDVDKDTGRVLKKDSYKPINVRESLRNLKVADFSLDNLQAVGAQLTECKMKTSTLGMIDSTEAQLGNIEQSIINNSNNE